MAPEKNPVSMMMKSDPKPTNSIAMSNCFNRHGGRNVATNVCPKSVAKLPNPSIFAINVEPIFSIIFTPPKMPSTCQKTRNETPIQQCTSPTYSCIELFFAAIASCVRATYH